MALVVLAGLAASGPPAAAQDRIEGNRYANPRYGLEIEKPVAWHFITATAVMDVTRKVAGLPPLPPGSDPVKAAGFAVIVSKVPLLGTEVAPQVVVAIHDLPQAPGDAVQACERLRTGMSDPEPVSPTRPAEVGGQPGARLEVKGVVDGNLVRATVACTFRDRRAFVVAAQALAAEFEGEATTFETILRTFRLR
jgi:hypothetical protein